MGVFPMLSILLILMKMGISWFLTCRLIQVIFQEAGYNCLGIILEEITCVLHVGYFNTDWTHTLH